jgi:hypothetical protein
MRKAYSKAAPKRAKRTNRDHCGVPQLAAKLSGRSLSTVYAVIYGRVKSACVEQWIRKAERMLEQREQVA